MIKSFIILLCFIGNQTHASDLIEVLKKNDATYEERQVVSRELAELLGKKAPLPVLDALAEICFDVDICASATSDEELDRECYEFEDEDYKLQLGDACNTKNIRKNYTCGPTAIGWTQKILDSFGNLLHDTNSYYRNQIMNEIYKRYQENYNVDLRITANIEAFFTAYPKEKEKLHSVINNAVTLGTYTGDCYQYLNRFLFQKEESKLVRYFNLYSSILNTLDVFPAFKDKVNRGVRLPKAALLEHHKVGNIVCYDGFTSTSEHDPKTDYSIKPRNYFLSGKCTQRLYMNYEDNGSIPGKIITAGSLFSSENEVLFAPGACFRIDKVTPRTEHSPDDEDSICEEGQSYDFEMTLMPGKTN